MVRPTLHPGARLSKLVEKQLHNWESARSQRMTTLRGRKNGVEDFVAMSRVPGSGGAQLARLLGEKLDWPVFDERILQTMAGHDDVRQRLRESMDDQDLRWIEQTMRSLARGDSAWGDDPRRLTETVLSIARMGHAIFLDPAADLILPGDVGLRVRIIAPIETCIENYAERYDLQPERARLELDRIDREQAECISKHFHVDAAEQTRHDMIINIEWLSLLDAANLIFSAIRLRMNVDE